MTRLASSHRPAATSAIPQPQPRRHWTEWALLGLLALLWGGSYLFINIAVEDIPPLSLIAIRVGGAAMVLSGIMAAKGVPLPRGRHIWQKLCLLACCNSILAWPLLAWGQQYVDASMATILNSTPPIFVVLFALLGRRNEAFGRLAYIGVFLGFLGVLVLMMPDRWMQGGADGLHSWMVLWGQIACLLGAACYGLVAIYGRALSSAGALPTATATMILASLTLLPASIVIDPPWLMAATWQALAAAGALSLLSTSLALLVYFRLLRTIGPLGVASQSYLRVCVGVGLSVLLLGEQLDMFAIIGLGGALIGVMLINRGVR